MYIYNPDDNIWEWRPTTERERTSWYAIPILCCAFVLGVLLGLII